jgi:hypothetical protein
VRLHFAISSQTTQQKDKQAITVEEEKIYRPGAQNMSNKIRHGKEVLWSLAGKRRKKSLIQSFKQIRLIWLKTFVGVSTRLGA